MKESDDPVDNSALPPIFRIGSSESDDSVEPKSKENSFSITETTIKFPTIGMSRTNSVSSFMSTPNNKTRKSRERSRRFQRNNMCKSPSCPADLGSSRRKSTELESPSALDKTILNASPTDEDKENDIKLPSIYRSVNSLSLPSERQASMGMGSWQSVPNPNLGGLRRTESCRESYLSSPTMDAKKSPRSQTHAALLLPLRTSETSGAAKAKKGNKKKVKNDYNNEENVTIDFKNGAQTWETEYETDFYNSARSNNTFERIAEETDSASHRNGSRKMKTWMKERQKEGQVKA